MRVCGWCGIRIHWPWQHCRDCRRALGDCGIYLQSGGPAHPYMSRLAPASPDPEKGQPR